MNAMAMTIALLLVLNVLWETPAGVESTDFAQPARGVALPRTPFQFVEEDLSGNSPKVMVRDSAGVLWQVKGGPEGRAEAFVTRIVSALGYFSDSVCFIPQGRIEGIRGPLKRASGFIARDGSFTYAGFERRDESARFLPEAAWKWNANPFTGTKELNGLKILVMLFSNWDNKDGRDTGPNTGVLEARSGDEVKRYHYITDWGQTLGGWGFWIFGRTNWNCHDFTRQTPNFLRGVNGDLISFGFNGQHTWDFRGDITREDVRWLMQWLGRITDDQVRTALKASGASVSEQTCFSSALRQRIETLREASTSPN